MSCAVLKKLKIILFVKFINLGPIVVSLNMDRKEQRVRCVGCSRGWADGDGDRCYKCAPKCASNGCGKLVRKEGWFCLNHRPRCASNKCGMIVSKIGQMCDAHRILCVAPRCRRSVDKPGTKCSRCVDRLFCTVCDGDVFLKDVMRCHSHAKRCIRFGCKQYTSKDTDYCYDCRCKNWISTANSSIRQSLSNCERSKNGTLHCTKCSSSFQTILILKRIMVCGGYSASMDIICMILRFAKLPFPIKKVTKLPLPSKKIVKKVNDS